MNDIVLTVDIDWAPDFVIDYVADLLISSKICATWFVTHMSPAVNRLSHHADLFELGIHPNFLPGTTQGNTEEEVLEYCFSLVPKARSLRTHGLVQSSPLLKRIATQTPITTDVSLFLPHMPNIRPFEFRLGGCTLLRVPFFWEDDLEMEFVDPCWHLTSLLRVGKGLKVFNFHPVHIFLNSIDLNAYQSLKQQIHSLTEATETDMATYVQRGNGTRTLFEELIEKLRDTRQSAVQDIYTRWQDSKQHHSV